MGTVTADPGAFASTANANFSGAAVHGTLPGADVTDGEMALGLGDAGGEVAGGEEF